MNYREACRVLGVTEGALAADITRAYRKLAMKHHPDRGGAEEKFKELQEALKTIQRPEVQEPKRASPEPESDWEDRYDTFKRDGRPPIPDLDEQTIGNMFGTKNKSSRENNESIQTIVLTIHEAFKGCYKSSPIPNSNSISGTPTPIRIPAGVQNGQLIESFKTPLHVIKVVAKIVSTFNIEWGNTDRINGGTISNYLYIPVTTMMVGGYINALMIDGGTVSIKIPPGLSANRVLRIRDRGYWTYQGSPYRGDCLLTAVPIIQQVKDLLPAERAILRKTLNEYS